MKTRKQKRKRKAAFTLVEVSLVTSIVGLLAAVGVPSIMDSHRNALAQAMVIDLDEFERGLEMYRIYNSGQYPDSVNQWGTPELKPYLPRLWPSTPAFEDKWKWAQVSGRLSDRILLIDLTPDGGSLSSGLVSALQLADEKCDDGSLSSGRLSLDGDQLKYYILWGGEDLDAGGGNNPGGVDPDNPGNGNGNGNQNRNRNRNGNGNS